MATEMREVLTLSPKMIWYSMRVDFEFSSEKYEYVFYLMGLCISLSSTGTIYTIRLIYMDSLIYHIYVQ